MPVHDGGIGLLARNALAAVRGRRPPFALCYHGVGHEHAGDDPHGLMVTPEAFAAHLDTLIGTGYRLVGITELWNAVTRGDDSAEGLGAISFDDGLADTLHTAAGLLTQRGATATAFLSTGLLGADHPDLPPGRRIVDRSEVLELEARGFEIGAHSVSHVVLPDLVPEQALDELRRSRADLEDLVGHEVLTMAYPFGRFDPATAQLAAQAGYRIACACSGAGQWEALALPREPVFPSTTTRRIGLKAAGLYGPFQALGRLDPRALWGPR